MCTIFISTKLRCLDYLFMVYFRYILDSNNFILEDETSKSSIIMHWKKQYKYKYITFCYTTYESYFHLIHSYYLVNDIERNFMYHL